LGEAQARQSILFTKGHDDFVTSGSLDSGDRKKSGSGASSSEMEGATGQKVCANRIYQNAGNLALLELVRSKPSGRALDCGCGAGDNARILSVRGWEVDGITISADEQSKASQVCKTVHIADLESGIPPEISGGYDLVIFSHVLEHLCNPSRVLIEVRRLLAPGGSVAVALPNVVSWRYRLWFLLGRFEYEEGGVMDTTHVRFYTFASGRRLLESNGFLISMATVEGIFPLARKLRLPSRIIDLLDRFVSSYWPGLFGWQLLYIASVGK
jgi:SAM-dependent methyltransferase